MSDQEVEGLVRKAELDYRLAVEYDLDPEQDADAILPHCQQCIEKYLKALIVRRGGQYPRTHRIEYLAKIAARREPEVNRLFAHLEPLKSNANFRYPGWDASAEDAETAREATTYLRSQLRALLALDKAT